VATTQIIFQTHFESIQISYTEYGYLTNNISMHVLEYNSVRRHDYTRLHWKTAIAGD